jgi:hypothetical protein
MSKDKQLKRFTRWLRQFRRTCPCCRQWFYFKTDEAMWGHMVCYGCAVQIKKLRSLGDERFIVHEYPE